MKVVIAIDSFKGSMSSIEAGEAAAAGIRKVYSEAKTKVYPLADGGEGTVRALAQGPVSYTHLTLPTNSLV